MNIIVFIVLIAGLLILALFVIPQWRLKRAIRQVIRIFRENNATDIKNAKTVDELGLKRRSMMEGLLKGRDYKPYAVNMLMRGEVIQRTEDGRLYFSEEKFLASRFGKGTAYSG